jgi:hypothetical protein
MNRLNKLIVFTSAVLIGTLFLHASAFAQGGTSVNALQNRIVGLWDVQVSISPCGGGDPVGGFSALHKFELGGTGQVVPATNPAALSAHMLIWEHLGGNDYHWFVKFFRFTNGVATAYNVIEGLVSISEDGTMYGGSGVASSYDLDGNYLGSSCPSFTGSRFTGN